jgi:hypothetical protein
MPNSRWEKDNDLEETLSYVSRAIMQMNRATRCLKVQSLECSKWMDPWIFLELDGG